MFQKKTLFLLQSVFLKWHIIKTTQSDTSETSSAATVAQDPEIITKREDGEIMPADLLMAKQSESSTISASERDTGELQKASLDSSSTTTLLLKRYLDHINFLDEMEYSTAINQLRDALDELEISNGKEYLLTSTLLY